MADIISGTEMRAAILDELRQEVEASYGKSTARFRGL